jgi:hypothetical protein
MNSELTKRKGGEDAANAPKDIMDVHMKMASDIQAQYMSSENKKPVDALFEDFKLSEILEDLYDDLFPKELQDAGADLDKRLAKLHDDQNAFNKISSSAFLMGARPEVVKTHFDFDEWRTLSTQKIIKGKPTQWSFDQRLMWFKVLCTLLEDTGNHAKRVLNGRPRLVNVTMDLAFILMREYGAGSALVTMANECLANVLPSLANLFDAKVFAPMRSKYISLLIAFICHAINLPLRVQATQCLEKVLLMDHYTENITQRTLMTCEICKIWKLILRGTKEDLTIATLKVMKAFIEKADHVGRMYLLDTVMLPEIVSSMLAPIASHTRVLALGRLFAQITAELNFDLLWKLIDTTPDLKPFLGLARSSHANRRDLVQEWLEFYGNTVVNFQDIFDAFTIHGTLAGFLYMATMCTDAEKAPIFRRIIFHIIVVKYQAIRDEMGSFGLSDFLHPFVIEHLVDLADKDISLIVPLVRFFHDFLIPG